MLKNSLFVGIGAAVGVLARYGCMHVIEASLALWVVNGMGSLLMGILNAYFEKKANAQLKLLLTTGFLGSFTTFSAFSADWLQHFQQSPIVSAAYAFSMTLCCIALAAIGYAAFKKVGNVK